MSSPHSNGKKFNSPIEVTKTFLPPKHAYIKLLDRIWDSGWITNRGEIVQELEHQIGSYLSIDRVLATANGTIALQLALGLIEGAKEVITTPFSYVATTSSIVWQSCKPVFVDINPNYLTIDESKIEQAITEKTAAILATHVFGNPCNIEAIELIAKRYNLLVIYDAAHCFGSKYKGRSLLSYGDVSICSFHATKVFHTGEGGMVTTTNERLFDRLVSFHNFGHLGRLAFQGIGINGKMSELQAAMGLCVLPYMDQVFQKRKEVVSRYIKGFSTNDSVRMIQLRQDTEPNYSYFPIICKSQNHRQEIEIRLEGLNVFARRYFYPSLNTLNYLEYVSMPISEAISERILCLPLSDDLDSKVQDCIIDQINLLSV